MATHTDALALTYARSLFEMAREAGEREKVEEVADELEQLVALTREHRDFSQFLASPIIDEKRRSDAIRRLFDGRLTDLTLRFMLVLNNKGRLGQLEAIADAYDHLVHEAFGRVEVDVFTASERLGDDAQNMIAERIQSALGKEPVLHTYTDRDMIGGIKLRIGDQLIDGSVQTQLRRMRANLLQSGGWKLRERVADLIDDAGETPSPGRGPE